MLCYVHMRSSHLRCRDFQHRVCGAIYVISSHQGHNRPLSDLLFPERDSNSISLRLVNTVPIGITASIEPLTATIPAHPTVVSTPCGTLHLLNRPKQKAG